jgi:hypothetical protein
MEKWAIIENFRFYCYEDKSLTQEEKAILEATFADWCRAESQLVRLIRKMGKVSAKRTVEELCNV